MSFLFSCQRPPAPPSIEEMTQLVEQLNGGMEDAFNKGAVMEVAAFYTDDAYLLGPGAYKKQGRMAIDLYWKRFKNPIQWTLDVIKVSKTEAALYETDYWKAMKNKPPHWNKEEVPFTEKDELLYQLGHSKLEYEREDDTHRTSHVDFIIIWKKQEDGQYKIYVDTYHQNEPQS